MTRPRYIASCSGGKDSVATILLAAEKNEPLDEVIYSEVMFDQKISGEVPEHRDFIHQKLKPFVENELGCKFTVLRSDKTYDDVFHHIITRGPYEGLLRGFVWPGKCAVNRDCKMPPLRKYHKAQPDDTRSYHRRGVCPALHRAGQYDGRLKGGCLCPCWMAVLKPS